MTTMLRAFVIVAVCLFAAPAFGTPVCPRECLGGENCSSSGGSGNASELIDDIPCAGTESMRRNAGDDAWECFTAATGGGEANTISSPDVGGLDLIHSTPKSGFDLRTVDMSSTDFDLASDVISIDDTTWVSETDLTTHSGVTDAHHTATTDTGRRRTARGPSCKMPVGRVSLP